jgi:hypothetical protein
LKQSETDRFGFHSDSASFPAHVPKYRTPPRRGATEGGSWSVWSSFGVVSKTVRCVPSCFDPEDVLYCVGWVVGVVFAHEVMCRSVYLLGLSRGAGKFGFLGLGLG